MKKYILTHKTTQGAITVGYDSNSLAVFFHNEMELDERQKKWVLKHFPYTEEHLKVLKDGMPCDIEEVATEISFEVFWEKYGKKVNKKRCEAIWAKMPERKRIQAVHCYWVYERYLTKTNFRAKADPETYLTKEYYLTDWDKVK